MLNGWLRPRGIISRAVIQPVYVLCMVFKMYKCCAEVAQRLDGKWFVSLPTTKESEFESLCMASPARKRKYPMIAAFEEFVPAWVKTWF